MDEPLTILIINFHSPQNAGDLALLQATINQLNKNFNAPKIIVSTNDPDHPIYSAMPATTAIPSIDYLINHAGPSGILKKLFKFISTLILCTSVYLGINPKRLPAAWQNLTNHYGQANLVISCPGNHFLTMGRFSWPLITTSLSILLAICFHKPLYIMPQSLGPLARWWEKLLLFYLYNQARYVFVRENISLELGLSVGLSPKRLFYIPDPAFSPPEKTEGLEKKILTNDQKNIGELKIGVTVISGMIRSLNKDLMDNYYSVLASGLSHMIEKYHATIYFFAQVVGPTAREDDRNAIHELMKLLAHYHDRVVNIEDPLSPDNLKQAYATMDLFIASRLHSGIFSICQFVPTIFIGYLTKTKGVLDGINYSNWLIPIENINESELNSKLEQLLAERDDIKRYLQGFLPDLISQTLLAGKLIAEDYDKLIVAAQSHENKAQN